MKYLLVLFLTGCATVYFSSESWLAKERDTEMMYLYAKTNGSPFYAPFYDSTDARITSAPVDSLTAKQLTFIRFDIRGMRIIDSLNVGDSAYYGMKRDMLNDKFNLAIAIERGKHNGTSK